MKLLISGSTINKNTLGQFYAKNLAAEGVKHEFLKFHDAYLQMFNNSKSLRIINRLFPEFVIQKMNSIFINQVDSFKPDVVLVFKGMEISRQALQKIKQRGVVLVNYNLDHPFEFFSKGTGNRFVKDAIPYYDLHITYSRYIQQQLADKYNLETAWLPFGFQLDDEEYEKVLSAHLPEIPRACFVGNPDSWRIESIGKLLQHQIPVDLYGFGWEKIKFKTNSSLLKIFGPSHSHAYWKDPLDFWKTIRQYRVQLNFFRPHNIHSHNLRTFEVPAVGGILLTPESDEQTLFFKEHSECFFYRSSSELVTVCQNVLNLTSAEAMAIRENARAKSLSGKYSFHHRTKELLGILKSI